MRVKLTLEEYITPGLLKGLRLYIGKRVYRRDREDMLQRVLLRACRFFESYNPKYYFSTWVYRIAQREIMRHIRDCTRHHRIAPMISVDPRQLQKKFGGRSPELAYNAKIDLWRIT